MQIKVALQSFLWPDSVCQHNLITSLVTQKTCLLTFLIFYFFDSVFHFSAVPCSRKLLMSSFVCISFQHSQGHIAMRLNRTQLAALQEPLQPFYRLQRSELLCLHLFPAETVINLHWLSHQAHSVPPFVRIQTEGGGFLDDGFLFFQATVPSSQHANKNPHKSEHVKDYMEDQSHGLIDQNLLAVTLTYPSNNKTLTQSETDLWGHMQAVLFGWISRKK